MSSAWMLAVEQSLFKASGIWASCLERVVSMGGGRGKGDGAPFPQEPRPIGQTEELGQQAGA